MKKILIMTIAAMLALFLSACREEAPPAASPEPVTSPHIITAPELPSSTPTPEQKAEVESQAYDHGYYDDNNVLILKVSVELPEIKSGGTEEGRSMINEYYRNELEKNVTYAETELYDMAINDKQNSDETGSAFSESISEQRFETTLNNAGILSVCRFYNSSDLSDVSAQGDTFNLYSGSRITVDELFTVPEQEFAKRLTENIVLQIKERSEYSDFRFFEDYAVYARDSFDKDNFYLTPEGIGFIYGLHTVAPPEMGVMRFVVPYEDIADIYKEPKALGEAL